MFDILSKADGEEFNKGVAGAKVIALIKELLTSSP